MHVKLHGRKKKIILRSLGHYALVCTVITIVILLVYYLYVGIPGITRLYGTPVTQIEENKNPSAVE